ncbi:MAG: pteridine reductase [Proteobacteria bacterium]|nr:pteridine reductase [Pseudomonadota bacterium]HQR05139.1 pteridine reductase [Rhodocyclaceae bacterium]
MTPLDQAPVILVTGAARRIGAEIARILHAAGARVVIHHRSSGEAARTLGSELNALRVGTAALVQGDLADPAGPAIVAQAALSAFSRIDGVVNNASSFFRTPLGSIDGAAWETLAGSNLRGPLLLSQALAPALRAGSGAIVNITDIHAERPLRGYPLYTAAKAGLMGLTRALAVELAPEVRVNAVAPGAIIWPDAGDDFPQEEQDEILRLTPLKRIGSPADIANTVKFLLFDAPFITGQVINVDGGRTAQL